MRSGETPVLAVALAFLVVIPQGSASSIADAVAPCFFGCHPAGICFFYCRCRCRCFLFVIPQGSASSIAVAVAPAFLVVIPQGSASSIADAVAPAFWLSSRRDLLLLLPLPLPLHLLLPFFLSSPRGICFFRCPRRTPRHRPTRFRISTVHTPPAYARFFSGDASWNAETSSRQPPRPA